MTPKKTLRQLSDDLELWLALRQDQGLHVATIQAEVRSTLTRAIRTLATAQPTRDSEPDRLEAIRRTRPQGPRDLRDWVNRRRLPAQWAGAWLGRAAGCTLGVPVENWAITDMERLARLHGSAFPPEDYWPGHPWPDTAIHGNSVIAQYLRGGITCVPPDDDLAYTLLGLRILEEYGPDFTTEDVAAAWLTYLPLAYTAEWVTLENLKRGLSVRRAALRNNPYVEWIGADIRCDAWGYVCAGWPEQAAEFAWRDAMVSHRGTGVYGAMFFAAAIAAAFVVETPMEALRIGLTEIPRSSRFARDMRWALKTAPTLRNWREARAAVDTRFPAMHSIHTTNNACLTIFGLHLGGGDFSKTIGLTVAMGLDNDCTAATAGSVLGAIIGKSGIPQHWWKPFRNRTRTYLTGHEHWRNADIVARIAQQHARINHG